nr:venom protein [Lampona murina]
MNLFCGFLLLQCGIKVLAESNSTATPFNSTEQRVDIAADALFDEYWQMSLMDNPETATTLGDHRYDDRLTGYSLKCYEKRKVMMTEFLERATQLLPLAPEGSDTHNNIQLFIVILKYQMDQLMSGSYLFPLSNLYTPQMSLRYLLKYTKLESAKNYWDLISRYLAVPQQIDEQIELMREGIRTNFTLNERSLWEHGGEQNNSIIDSPFYKPFLTLSSTVSAEEAENIQGNASDAVMNSIYPAFKKLDDFMENEYRPNARTGVGVGSLPSGQEYYRQQLSYHLTDQGITAEEIHAMGLSEVERIAEEMAEVIQSLGLNMTMKEFSDKLRNDESQFFISQEEALETYRNIIENEISPKLPILFKNIPGKILTVENIPKDLSSGPRAFYMSPTPDNSTPATFFLDTSSLANLPKYEAMTLAMHEGVPGHHFQISYAMEQNDKPDFQKYGFNSNAFTEGWALYAEYLGYELGLYEDPYMRYGHLSEEIFRACRMVVDTGMHVFGWSRQKAIDYMMNYSASTLNNTEREVDRYITWPGQACAYKYGELKIKELRKRTESSLGQNFDIKEFHDIVLRNSGPLELVEKQVDRYIEMMNNAVLDG